jgi:hypothetical protein
MKLLQGKTQEVVDAEAQAVKDAADKAQVLSALAANDLKAIRSLIAINSGSATKEDYDKIKALSDEAVILRKKLSAKGALNV